MIGALVKLPGIGLWTAEMLMIFALNRMDILSFGDFAIRKGMMRLYGLENLDKPTFLQIKGKLSPITHRLPLLWEIAAEAAGMRDGNRSAFLLCQGGQLCKIKRRIIKLCIKNKSNYKRPSFNNKTEPAI